MLTYYRAWIPEQHRARVRPLLEAMNTSDGSSLRLPVEPLPAELNWEGSGPTFAWELNAGLRAGIGKYTGYDVFDQPGWTLEKFAEFVTSRSHLHIVIDRCVRPTLAALAGYLQTPILVDQVLPGGRQALLLSTDGNVTILGYEDGQEDLADLREAFFTQGLEAALAVPGWTLSKSGPPNPYSARDYAFQRRMDLVEWQGAVEDGTVAVPKGAELIPINLMIVGHGDLYGERPAIGRVRTSKHLYEVLVPSLDELAPLEVICAVDGVLQRFVDPVTGEDKGLGAHAGDWADWIARDSIAGGQSSAGKPWEGNGPEARLYRLAHDILSYEDHRADTTYFSTGREVEAWLRRALGNHNAPIAVSVLDDVSFTLAAEGPTLIQKHVFERSGGLQAGYQANAFRPWAGTKNWWDPDRRTFTRIPSLQTGMDGQHLESYTAANCLDYADVEPHLLPADARANENSWFVVRLGGTPTCIAFPSQRTILTVNTDHDGAAAEITAHQYFRWSSQYGRKRAFKEQWARWLDEDQPLTQDEIQEGLKALGQIIERSDDEPDDE